MRKWPKTDSEDLWFVRKYGFSKAYHEGDERCPHVKAKIRTAGALDFEEVDGIFLCCYPDEKMPTHEARLTSELDQYPNPERREMIDALDTGEV